MTIRGKAHKFGDHIDTDVIIPATYLDTTDAKELAPHCMEGIAPDFPSRVKPGDVIVAGENFGCGSSREHAPLAIKGTGISCVVAASFARIFFRNAINIGLALVTSAQASREVNDGDELGIDLATGTITNLTRSEEYQGEPFPEFVREIIEAGGLVEYTRRRLAGAKSR